MMVYNTQNCLILDCQSSSILKFRKINMLETDSISETLCILVFRIMDD
jgi:hypothetical protein